MVARKIHSQGTKLSLLGELQKLGRMFSQEITAQPSLNLALGFLRSATPWIWKSHGVLLSGCKV